MKISDYLRLALLFALLIAGGGFISIWAIIWFTRGSYLTAAQDIIHGSDRFCASQRQ